jgi:hypothetical protein
MARLQILELPTVYRRDGTDETPFVLVVDQALPQRYVMGADQEPPVSEWEQLGRQIGARSVIVTPETIDIPANDIAISTDAVSVSQPIRYDVTGIGDQAVAAFADRHRQVDEMEDRG